MALAHAERHSRFAPSRTFDPTAPSLSEVLLLAGIASIVFAVVILKFDSYSDKVINFGDSSAYMSVAHAIRHWNFSGLEIKQFWGLPYLMAVLSAITRISDETSLLVVSAVCYFVSAVLAFRLWGGWVAVFFSLLNFDWLQRAFLGGSEPLFVALLFGAFVAARSNRWIAAAAFSALATTVRRLGLIALVSVGLLLLFRKEYAKLGLAFTVGIAIGLAYILPILYATGDPLATVHSYTQTGSGPSLFGIPLYAIIKGTIGAAVPWTNLALSFVWIALVLGGCCILLTSPRFRDYRKSFPLELFFCAGYLLAICSYNLPGWARGTFARFAIPIIPFAIIGVLPWIPKSRWIPRTLAVLCPALAASSAIGIVNVIHRLR